MKATPPETAELIALVAWLMMLNALCIDIMLPALPSIDESFGLQNPNDRQLIVIGYIFSFGVAQFFFGPVTDACGRRPVLLASLLGYTLGSLFCALAWSFPALMIARVLQGVAAAGVRVVAVATVRDLTEGKRLAQVLSLAMSFFMITPVVAPGVGQLILLVAAWQWTFLALAICGSFALAWTYLRLPETLAEEHRTPMRFGPLAASVALVCSHRTTFGYSLAASFLFAAHFGFIAVSQQLFVDVFHLGTLFPAAFASVAVMMSASAVVNAGIVGSIGAKRLAHVALVVFLLLSAVHVANLLRGRESLTIFLSLLAPTVFSFGLMLTNFSAIAMEPMGNNAGGAAAIFGSLTTVVGAICGGVIGRAFDGTPLPFVSAQFLLGLTALAVVLIVERGRLLSVREH